MSSLLGGGLIMALANYFAFDRHDRWKKYAAEFKQYSKQELLIGRLLVALFVVLSFAALCMAIVRYQSVHAIRQPLNH